MKPRSAAFSLSTFSMSAALGAMYLFLYAPILYVIYTSFAADIVWPFPHPSRSRPTPICSTARSMARLCRTV